MKHSTALVALVGIASAASIPKPASDVLAPIDPNSSQDNNLLLTVNPLSETLATTFDYPVKLPFGVLPCSLYPPLVQVVTAPPPPPPPVSAPAPVSVPPAPTQAATPPTGGGGGDGLGGALTKGAAEGAGGVVGEKAASALFNSGQSSTAPVQLQPTAPVETVAPPPAEAAVPPLPVEAAVVPPPVEATVIPPPVEAAVPPPVEGVPVVKRTISLPPGFPQGDSVFRRPFLPDRGYTIHNIRIPEDKSEILAEQAKEASSIERRRVMSSTGLGLPVPPTPGRIDSIGPQEKCQDASEQESQIERRRLGGLSGLGRGFGRAASAGDIFNLGKQGKEETTVIDLPSPENPPLTTGGTLTDGTKEAAPPVEKCGTEDPARKVGKAVVPTGAGSSLGVKGSMFYLGANVAVATVAGIFLGIDRDVQSRWSLDSNLDGRPI
ncbi:hypothetical protein QBC38DRAFT_517135 [Podospora fimiseda]|uniref:Uncharacterized protein n=1 Tax=Podospora fimiseda TaxID=252190 RepID=A0AAN7BH82_9PEZI|nr:hypothetical protein QBC38DRAFT_517135 [Podospora fimiseda]